MGVDSVQISGPYGVTASGETPGRRQIFVCYPIGRENEQSCAKQILSTLARRAYRRPVTDQDVRTLHSIYKVGRGKGSFEAGIELALRAILVDPDFLYRVERDPVNVAPATPLYLPIRQCRGYRYKPHEADGGGQQLDLPMVLETER